VRKALRIAAAMAAAAMLAGCLEVRQDYTLNPDGSGKVAVDLLMQEVPVNVGQADKPDPEVLAKQTVRQILDASAGVDAWADVAFSRTDGERLHFKGTAYFRDFSKWNMTIAGLLGVTFAKDEKGGMTLLVDRPPEKAKAAAAPPQKLTEAEIDRRVKAEREAFRQKRPWLESFLAKTRVEMSFRLPGTRGEVSNLQNDEGGALRFVLEGPKLLQAIDQLTADDQYLRDRVVAEAEAGQGGARRVDALNEKLFGSRAPIRARVTGDLRPLFDYEAEMKAAKEAYPKMVERLGLADVPSTPPAESGRRGPAK